MFNLSMCRICMVEDLRMHCLVNSKLQEIYEKLTTVAFMKNDSRPLQICYICYARLQNCYQLQATCLQSEELFNQMLENNKVKSPLQQNRIHFKGLEMVRSVVNIGIDPETLEDYIFDIKTEPRETITDVRVEEEYTEDFNEPQRSFDYAVTINTKTDNVSKDDDSVDNDTQNMESRDYITSGTPKPAIEDAITVEYNPIVTRSLPELKKPKEEPEEDTQNAYSSKFETDVSFEYNINFEERSLATREHMIEMNIDDSSKSFIPPRDKRYKCDLCEKYFIYKSVLNKHYIVHTREKPFKCELCSRSFARKEGLNSHMQTHGDKKSYKCDVCGKCYYRKRSLIDHIGIHTVEKNHICAICGKCFGQKKKLTRHMAVHTEEKPYKCDACKKCFMCRRNLIEHIRIHTGEKPYKCNICGKRYRLRQSFQLHIAVHNGDKRFKCDVCDERFLRKALLNYHMHKHTKETPHKCHICGKFFTRTSILNNHILSHTNENFHKCNICQKTFGSKADLTVHIRVHTGEKPYKCEICGKCFSQKASLTVHIRTHTGEKPYKCDICDAYYPRKNLHVRSRAHRLKANLINGSGES